jgi:hypothetical protein
MWSHGANTEALLDERNLHTGALAVTLSVSDQAELIPLCDWLARVPGARVDRRVGPPKVGMLGDWQEVVHLAVAAGGGGVLTMAIRTLPEFVRSRRSSIEITMEVGDEKITLNASNVEDAMSLMIRMLDERRLTE